MELLLKKYQQAGAMATFKTQILIDAVTMRKKKDPAMVIKKLANIIHKYEGVLFVGINETMLILHLIKIAPKA